MREVAVLSGRARDGDRDALTPADRAHFLRSWRASAASIPGLLRVVAIRCFGGTEDAAIAEAHHPSKHIVTRAWHTARALLASGL
jgi:hypothetical protein